MNKQILIIAKKELSGFINNPIGGIFTFALISIAIFLAIEIGQFIEYNEASLYSLFQFMPWLFAFFIPSLSMRVWADENKGQTIETLLSLPLSNNAIVIGKFFACLLMIIIALALTFPFWIFVNFLGKVDNQIVIGGYFANILLGALFLALSFAVNINIKTPAIAFLLANAVCFLFCATNIPMFNDIIAKSLNFIGINNNLNFVLMDNFDNLIRGNYAFNSLLFFISITIGMLLISIINLECLKKPNGVFFQNKLKIVSIITTLLLIQFLGNIVFANKGIDISQDRIFSLNKETISFIKNEKNKIEIDFYFSKNAASQNPDLRILGQNINDKLFQYSNISRDKVKINLINITQFSKNEEIAIANGLVPYTDNLANLEPIYLGLVIKINGKEFVFRRIGINDYEQLEFSLNKAILALSKNRRETIAIISAQDWFIKKNQFGQFEPLTQISKSLYQDYSIINLEPNFNSLPINLDLLFIAAPWDLSENEQYLIDQYVVNGGKVLLALDGFSNISFDNQIGKVQYTQSLGRLAANWGIVFSNQIILDKKNALMVYANINNRQTALPQPAFLKLSGQKIFGNVNFASVSSFLKPNINIGFEPIIETSNQTMLMSAQDFARDSSPQSLLENWVDDGNSHIIAAKIYGKINSSFGEKNNAFNNIDFIQTSKKEAKIYAIADTDFLFDSLYINDNIKDAQNSNFIFNLIEDLLGNENSNILNTKQKPIRNLELIAKAKSNAQNQIIDNENKLLRQIEEIEIDIENLSLSNVSQNIEKLKTLRIDLLRAKQKLLATQDSIRQTTQNIKNLIILICGILTPLLFLIYTLFNFYRRNMGAKIAKFS